MRVEKGSFCDCDAVDLHDLHARYAAGRPRSLPTRIGQGAKTPQFIRTEILCGGLFRQKMDP